MNSNSSRRQNSRRNPTSRDQLASIESRQLAELKDMKNLMSVSTFGYSPSVPDVPRLHISPRTVYTFSRMCNLGALTATNTLPGTVALTFALSNVPNASDITNFFDQYRILQVNVILSPSATATQNPVYSAIDYDDGALPGSAQDVLEKETAQINNNSQSTFVRTVNPRVLNAVYQSGVSTGYSTIYAPWLDSANSTVPHYGLKLYASATGSGTNQYQIIAEYIIQGRFAS